MHATERLNSGILSYSSRDHTHVLEYMGIVRATRVRRNALHNERTMYRGRC